MTVLEDIRKFPNQESTLLKFLEDPAVVITRTRKIVYFNPAFERRFGCNWDTDLGRLLDEVIPAYAGPRIWQYMETLEVHSTPQHFWVENESQALRLSLAPVSIRERAIGAVVSFRDATAEGETKRLNMVLFNALVDDFEFSVAELDAMMNMLQNKPSAAPSIHQHSQTQMQQIKDRLKRFRDFSELLFGNLVPSWVPFQPMQLLSLMLKTLRQGAKGRGVILEESAALELPEVMGDPAYLNRVLGLLVDHVIKSVPPGELVAMAASVMEMPDGTQRLVYSVTGTGWVLTEDIFSGLTHRLKELLAGEREQDKQTFLRLLIVQRLVRTMKGSVTMAAHEMAGTTFSISIPTAIAK